MQRWENSFRWRTQSFRSNRNVWVWGMIGLALLVGGRRAAEAQVVQFAGNNHYYEAVAANISWPDARDAAAARSYQGLAGHLVTITSAAEQTFVTTTFPAASPGGYWLGAYQDKAASNFSEPAGGWHWITGEPWNYTSWNSGEPNNNGGFGPSEDYVSFAANGNWNDSGTPTSTTNGYIVEYELPRPFFDVNRDGYADILFQNTVTHQVSYWAMKGATSTTTSTLPTIPAAGYAVVGVGDFNGDGNPDLVFQNTTNGQVGIWYLNGTNVIGAQSVDTYPASGYAVVGVGDFNGDGKPDLVFQNATSGQIAIWYMNGTAIVGADSTQARPSTDYKVVGVGDFNGDGKPDLVFQHNTSGAIVFWYMNGAQYQSGAVASAAPFASYRIVGINDYNNDGHADILFQNATTGQIALWFMNGANLIGGGVVGTPPDSNSVVVGPR